MFVLSRLQTVGIWREVHSTAALLSSLSTFEYNSRATFRASGFSLRTTAPWSNSKNNIRPDSPMFRLITSSSSANVPDDLEALANAARSNCPILDFKAHTTDSNGLDVVRLKRSTSTFLTGIGWFLSG